MEIRPRSSRSQKGSTTNSTTGKTSTGYWVRRLLAFPSRILLAGASVSWCPRRSTSTP
ncbi:hypothetical protein LINPERPRIM_LOCUS28887 [Linum perenne]